MSSFRIVGRKQEVDPCYGLYDLYIDRDDIEALLSGKKLYSTISFDEYAITIEMEEKMSEPECKNCKHYKGNCGHHHVDSLTGHINYEIPAERMYVNKFDPSCYEWKGDEE